MNTPSNRSAQHISFLARALLLLAPLSLSACQSYQPRPLDLQGTKAAYLARSPEDQSIKDFADFLATQRISNNPTTPLPEFNPSDGLSLYEAQLVALIYNPDLHLLRLESGRTLATMKHAGLWQDPTFGLDLERIISDLNGADPWAVGSTIGITIPVSGRLSAEKATATAQHAAQLDQIAASEWATQSALRQQWILWSAALLEKQITIELIASLREIVAVVDKQQTAGTLSRIDARIFHVELAARQSDLIEYEARVKEHELELRAMMGLSPQKPLTLHPALTFSPRARDSAQVLAQLEASHPELNAIRAEYEVSEHQLRTQIRAQYPDITLAPGYGSDQGDSRLLLGVSFPIPLWNRNQQAIAQATAQRELAKGRFETTYHRLNVKLAQALITFQAGLAQREWVESTLIPLVTQQESDLRKSATIGRVDPLIMLEALKTQHAAKLRLIYAQKLESQGAIRLDELIGPDFSNVLQN